MCCLSDLCLCHSTSTLLPLLRERNITSQAFHTGSTIASPHAPLLSPRYATSTSKQAIYPTTLHPTRLARFAFCSTLHSHARTLPSAVTGIIAVRPVQRTKTHRWPRDEDRRTPPPRARRERRTSQSLTEGEIPLPTARHAERILPSAGHALVAQNDFRPRAPGLAKTPLEPRNQPDEASRARRRRLPQLATGNPAGPPPPGEKQQTRPHSAAAQPQQRAQPGQNGAPGNGRAGLHPATEPRPQPQPRGRY